MAKIVEVLEKACTDVPIQRSLLFFHERIVPAMFNTSQADIRGSFVEFVFACLPRYGIDLLSSEKQAEFKMSTMNIYVKTIDKLQELGDVHWKDVWIFLVRCHGKRLYTNSDILNALLRVVETAFRSIILEHKIAAYDCWKELMEMYSLDLEQMCSPKYMKLLLRPLQNRYIKNKHLTKKRFEVWAHLISTLKEKSLDLCIREFLEFCFGPLGENPLITQGNPNIGSPARNDPEVWPGSAQALLEIIGHYGHDTKNSCMVYANYPLFNLAGPLITSNNFMSMDYVIINSVGESCCLMLDGMNDPNKRQVYIQVITCLWGSLFTLIEQLNETDQEKAIQRVTSLLAVYVELSNKKDTYFEYILKPIFELLSNRKFFGIDVLQFHTQLLFPLLKTFLKHNDAVFLKGNSLMLELLQCSKNIHNRNSWLKEAYDIFAKADAKSANIKGLLSLWIQCADVLNGLCEFPTLETEKVIQSTAIAFMVWPVLKMYQLVPEEPLFIKEFAAKWNSTFASLLKTYTKESLVILRELEKSVKDSPFLAAHFMHLFPGFQPFLDTEPNHKFVITLLGLTSSVLAVPSATKGVKNLVLPTVLLIKNYFIQETEETSKYSDFQHLCQCFEHLLHLHKELSVLQPMEDFFDKIPNTFKEYVPESLCEVINALKTHHDENIVQKAQHLLSKFSAAPRESTPKADETFLRPQFIQSSRAAKITSMALAKPKSSKADNLEDTSTVLRLFGHRVQTSSPLRPRGSQMNNNTKSRKRKATNIFSELKTNQVMDDGDEASYVLIDQQYQFDPTKLSEHQLEVMKKRRSDIPALYQDLSQSQSSSESFLNYKSCGDNQKKCEGDNKEKETFVGVANADIVVESKSPSENNCTLPKKLNKKKETDVNVTVTGVVSQQVDDIKTVVKELTQEKINIDEVERTTSEDLFQSEDVTVRESLLTSKLSEKTENCTDNSMKKCISSEAVVSEQSKPVSSLSEAQARKSKLDEQGINQKSLKIVLPRIEDSFSFVTKKTKEEIISHLNLPTHASFDSRSHISKPKRSHKETKTKVPDEGGNTSVLNELHLKEKGTADPGCKSDIKKSEKSVNHDSGDTCNSTIDLKIQNPSMRQIEAMITEDSPSSNYSQGLLMTAVEQNTDNETVHHEKIPPKLDVAEDEQLPCSVNEENKDENSVLEEEKKKQKIKKELNRIKMDIVGGDAFVRNLDFTERRQTRRSLDLSTHTLRSGSKINYDSDDSKSSGSIDFSRKRKLRATVKVIEKASKDKLTLSPKSSNKARQLVTQNSPDESSLKHISNDAKLSPISCKVVLKNNADVEVERVNLSSVKRIRSRRKSEPCVEENESSKSRTYGTDINIEAESSIAFPNKRLKRSSSTVEKSDFAGNTASPSRGKSGNDTDSYDKNKIVEARSCSSMKESARPNKEKVRKSLSGVLESVSKEDRFIKADLKNLPETNFSTKANQIEEKTPEDKLKGGNKSDFTVTLVSNTESQNSEDIIESSQESSIEIMPCQTPSGADSSLESIRKNINLEIGELVTRFRKEKKQNSSLVSIVIENRTNALKVEPHTCSSETKDAECNTLDAENKIPKDSVSAFSPDELMRMDLMTHKSNQNDTSEMDTETLEMSTDIPSKSVSIPTSPVGSDTPTRTSELINNTINISPIKYVPENIAKKNNSEITPDLFDSEPCTSNKALTARIESKPEDKKLLTPVLNDTETEPASVSESNLKCDFLPSTPSCSGISGKASARLVKLLKLVPYTPSPEILRVERSKQIPKPHTSTTKTHRITKMMQIFEQKSQAESSKEVIEIEEQDEEFKRLIPEKDILEFVRELPSPMASPRNSILKRRAPDTRDEGLSPPRKKRVNFSDPPTTCEKIFFKDKNEHPCVKKDKIEQTGDANCENTITIQEVENVSTSNNSNKPYIEPPILEPMEYTEPPILENMKNTPLPIISSIPTLELSNNEPVVSEKETESLNVETQGSMDVTIPYLLEQAKPVFPELVDCKESIHSIIGKMTSPLFVSTLADELKNKNIFTVGDLAKLSEMEVSRLPFRTPKVLVVRTALRKLMSQKSTESVNTEAKMSKNVGNKFKINDNSFEEKECTKKRNGLDNFQNNENTKTDASQVEDVVDNSLSSEQQKLLVQSNLGNAADTVLSLAASTSPNVKIVSSILVQPARGVPPSCTKTEKIPRRVPLIKVADSQAPTCSTYVEADPVLSVTVAPSSTEGSKNDKTIVFGNVEEREKLRNRIPELIADFEEMREKVKRQGWSSTSLYELLIEIVGTEEFISILRESRALSVKHVVRSGDWCAVIDEIVKSIGLSKIIFCLCQIPKITPLRLVDNIFDYIPIQHEVNIRSRYLEKVVHRILKAVPLPNILKKFGMRCIVDALCEMKKSLEFTTEDFFQHATFRFNPSLDDMVPCFRNINIVQSSDNTVQLASKNKVDLGDFLEKISTVAKKPPVSKISTNRMIDARDIVESIPEAKKDEMSSTRQEERAIAIVDKISVDEREELTFALADTISVDKQEELAFAITNRMSLIKQKELAFSVFDKMSNNDVYYCLFGYYTKRLQET